MKAGLKAAPKGAAPETSRSRAHARLQTAPAPGPSGVEPALGNQAVQRFLKTARRSAAQDPHDRAHSLSQAPYQLQRKTSCACGGGCPTCQAKSSRLNISQPGDAGEIEADQIADAVMRMPADETLPTAKIHSHAAIHRKCDACEDEEEKNPRKALPAGEGGLTPHGPEHVQSAISSAGNPLDRAIRNFFEPRLGSDLSAVRIHTGSAAAESAKAISAKAYTFGSNIVFGSGEYKPDSEGGKHLLAHELAHVSQSSSTATRRHTIYRQTDEGQILTEIQMLRTNLMAPVNPLAGMQRARLIELEAMLGQAAGKPAPPSKPNPSLDLPFSARFAQAWTQAKEATRRKVVQEDRESGSSIARNLIKVNDLVPTPSDVWKTGIYAGLFKNDEWDRVEEYSLHIATETFEKRYEAAKYGQSYGEEDKVSGERSNTDADIWSRGRRFGLFLPSEKATVLRIPATGISRAVWLNYMAKTVDLNSPDAVALRDEIHRFADDPAVVLLGPEMERLFGPYEYKYRDEPNRWFAADMINDAYKKSLGGRILGDPNASLQQRWTECLRLRNFDENNLEQAAFDPKCFQSPAEFDKEYYRRVGEQERRKVDECPSRGPDKYTCQDKIDLEYYPTRTAQKDYAMRQAYQQYQEHIESVQSGGAFATLGRLGGYVAAKVAGRDEDEALRWSEGGAAIGSLGDAALTVKAGAVARTGFQNYNEGPSVSRDVPLTPPPQNVAPPPTNEPIPPPVDTSVPTSKAVTDPWAGSVTRPVDLSKNLQTAEPPAVTTAKAPAAPDPRVIEQEKTVNRRIDAVKVATENYNQVSIEVNQAEAAVASAKQQVDAAKAQADTARQAAEQAATAAQGLKRNTDESKNATAKRNDAARAERAVPRAEAALKRANADLTRARGNAVRAAQRASDARDALQTSQKHLDRLRSNPDYGRRQLTVVQPERTLQGPAGGTVVDRGYEGARGREFFGRLGLRSPRWARTDANYKRMLDGRPPIGEDGAPINLHHRTRGPMSQLDEYTETQHRELGLHEPGLDSEIDRQEFDRERERYWVQRARDLLDKR